MSPEFVIAVGLAFMWWLFNSAANGRESYQKIQDDKELE